MFYGFKNVLEPIITCHNILQLVLKEMSRKLRQAEGTRTVKPQLSRLTPALGVEF